MQCVQIASGSPLTRSSSSKLTSDQTLIVLIANGDKDAMRVLFARHNLPVFRFLRRIVRDEATAEDLVNEVFLQVWRNASSLRGPLADIDMDPGDCSLQGAGLAAAAFVQRAR